MKLVCCISQKNREFSTVLNIFASYSLLSGFCESNLFAFTSFQNFALGKGDEEVIATLQNFAKTVGEVKPIVAILLFYMFVFAHSIPEGQ